MSMSDDFEYLSELLESAQIFIPIDDVLKVVAHAQAMSGQFNRGVRTLGLNTITVLVSTMRETGEIEMMQWYKLAIDYTYEALKILTPEGYRDTAVALRAGTLCLIPDALGQNTWWEAYFPGTGFPLLRVFSGEVAPVNIVEKPVKDRYVVFSQALCLRHRDPGHPDRSKVCLCRKGYAGPDDWYEIVGAIRHDGDTTETFEASVAAFNATY